MRRASGRRHRARRTRRAVTKAGRAVSSARIRTRGEFCRGPGIARSVRSDVWRRSSCPVAPGARPARTSPRPPANCWRKCMTLPVNETSRCKFGRSRISTPPRLADGADVRWCENLAPRQMAASGRGNIEPFGLGAEERAEPHSRATSRKATAGGAAPGCRPRRSRDLPEDNPRDDERGAVRGRS